ncbi:hypothetical protein MD588_23365 [Photobacterium sp. SDRW27]|uniref:hypothetical protein n=1 Tax=Photobacterium obscurum TaxID=2829490 RepID=UPI0022438FEE|nr:hypothetical protein [Photobacterium obscurum]MCW8331744.1 hypothetical protein [Photobacterium obscurum]
MQIHVDWNGSYTLEDVKKLTDGDDYGLYQIYGAHPVYGTDVLLYIGKASSQTLGVRISQHEKWLYNQDSENIRVYTGHLGGNVDISNEEWANQIDIAEKLLIFTHKPAYNSSNINSIPDIPVETHVFNWCDYRSLMPEVSAFRYLATDDEHFSTYRNFSTDH